MKRTQQGFTLIELMIVVAIIGILAAVALPAYQDYTNRAKMSEVIAFAASAKTAVTECLMSKNVATDCDTNEKVGIEAAASLTSKYVESVTVGTGAAITVAIQGTNVTNLDAGSLVLESTLDSAKGVSWSCKISNANIAKYFPTDCRTVKT